MIVLRKIVIIKTYYNMFPKYRKNSKFYPSFPKLNLHYDIHI